jgi:hypothetical protein
MKTNFRWFSFQTVDKYSISFFMFTGVITNARTKKEIEFRQMQL